MKNRGKKENKATTHLDTSDFGPGSKLWARPEVGHGSGFQWAWVWLKVQKAQSLGSILEKSM